MFIGIVKYTMNIKNLKPTKNGKTKQGYFDISESTKYNGKVKTVIYRSSWEHMFCPWCERNPLVEKWCSESVQIKYHCPIDNTVKNYYPDFWIKLTDGRTMVVEVKPAQEYKIEPSKPKRKTQKSLARYKYLKNAVTVNLSKFKSAISYCKSRGWTFFVADETWFGLNKK